MTARGLGRLGGRVLTSTLALAALVAASISCSDSGDSTGPGGQGGDRGQQCEGDEGCACYANQTCDGALVCVGEVCRDEGGASGGAGDGGRNPDGNGGSGNAAVGGSTSGSGGRSGGAGNGATSAGGDAGAGFAGDGSGASGNTDPIDFVDPVAGTLRGKTISLYAATTSVGHGCISTEAGEVYCFGPNPAGQLGNGTDYDSTVPVKVKGITTAEKVVTGADHSCALLADDTVRCWGDNDNHALGTGDLVDAWEPIEPVGLTGIVDIAARSSHSCVARDDGKVLCWGWSGDHLGHNTIGSTPKEVPGLAGKATAVVVGGSFSCALLEEGSVQCWGSNNSGQLGHGNQATASSRVPVTVAGIDSAIALSAGPSHACALLDDGTVWCWGSGNEHQLGKNAGSNSFAPTQVKGIDDATSVAAGLRHTCATRENGTVSCWGQNDYGEAGTATTRTVLRAWDVVQGIDDAVQVWAGTYSTCAVLSGGAVQCWGNNESGRMALDGSLTYALVHRTPAGFLQGGKWYAPNPPRTRPGAGDIARIVASTGRTCVVRTNGDVHCWGSNQDKRIGDGAVNPVLTPTKVNALADVAELTDFGSGQMCARKTNGQVQCLGGSAQPVRVDHAIAITNGYDFACAIVDSLAIQCWGNDFAHTHTLSRGAVDVTAGSNHMCAVMSGGNMHCWGFFDEASLGSNEPGLYGAPYEPSNVEGVTNARQAAAGLSHTCALADDGRVKCWGAGNDGQIGNGTGMYSRLPVDVGLSDVTQIASGWYHSCAVTSSGALYCWGDNAFGQIGDDDVGDATAPKRVVGISDAVQVTCGQQHSCALHVDGKMSCWGRNQSGELGDGTRDDSPVPVFVGGL